MKLKSFSFVSLCGLLCLSSVAFIACGEKAARSRASVGELAKAVPWTDSQRAEFNTQCSVQKSVTWCECVAPILETNTSYSEVIKDSNNQPSDLRNPRLLEKLQICGRPTPPEEPASLPEPIVNPLPSPPLAPTIPDDVLPNFPEALPSVIAPTATATPAITAEPAPSAMPEVTPEPTVAPAPSATPEITPEPTEPPDVFDSVTESFRASVMNCSGRSSLIARLPGVEPFCFLRLKKVTGGIENYSASFVAEEGDCRVAISRADILFAGFTFRYAMTDSGSSRVCKGNAVFKELSTGRVQEVAVNF